MPRLSCGVRCSRIMLIILNIVFLLLGLAIFGMGIYIKVYGFLSGIATAYNITESLGNETMQLIGTMMIVIGVLTLLLAAFGVLGAVAENQCFLYAYVVALSLVLLLEFAGVIVTLKFQSKLWYSYDSGFSDVFKRAYTHNQTDTIKVIEQLEREFNCCGVDSYNDYINISRLIPNSCYLNQKPIGLPFNKGCATAVTGWVVDQLPIIAGILGVILFIEIFGITASSVLAVAISHSSTAVLYYGKRNGINS